VTRGDAPDAGLLSGHYGIEAERIERLGEGLINRTFLARSSGGKEFVLQRVNPMFSPEVHEDIEAITAHVADKGLLVPRLVRTRDGALCTRDGADLWRLMTRLPGESRSTLRRAAEAESAGEMLARFHAALLDLDHEFHSVRPGVHDTPRHLQRLRETVASRPDHPRFAQVEPLAKRILAAGGQLPELPIVMPRIVHGDPKINNFLFEPKTDRVLCLVDFDTLSRMALPLELGDAFRSWCNPGGEDTTEVRFAPEMMLAGARGYARGAAPWITETEIGSIVPATLTICVELAARFCADALNEDFFAWDPLRFANHSEHSEIRAAGQLALSESFRSQMRALARELPAIFAAAGARS
jgi:Ser/Thr protein kinase RdoA (MazF antagonist)